MRFGVVWCGVVWWREDGDAANTQERRGGRRERKLGSSWKALSSFLH